MQKIYKVVIFLSFLFVSTTGFDYNICDLEGSCDQICTNGNEGFNCSCVEGYELIGSLRCVARNEPEEEPFRLIIASRVQIEEIYENGTSVPGNSTLSINKCLAMNFDYKNRTVCWVSTVANEATLSCADVDNLSNSWIIKHNRHYELNYVDHVARDWVTGNWYILDSSTIIFMCNATFEICITLVDAVMSKPMGFALDPSTGYMFFTSYGYTGPKIDRALMDGTERETIVKTEIVYPFGVTIDYPNRHVYWVNADLNYIERVDYNGNNRRIIYRNDWPERLSGITLFENYLYVTSWRDNTIKRINRFQFNDPEEIISVKVANTELRFIYIFHSQRQPSVPHPCGINNGGCSHFCFPLWKGEMPVAKCQCHPGYLLKEDGFCVDYEANYFTSNCSDSVNTERTYRGQNQDLFIQDETAPIKKEGSNESNASSSSLRTWSLWGLPIVSLITKEYMLN